MACTSGPSGEALLVIAALVSFQLAQDRSNDELGVLAAFFTVLGDNLALIAARSAAQEACCLEAGAAADTDTDPM